MSEPLEQYLSFFITNEEYAIEIEKVVEIRGWEEPTPLPKAPSHIKGVINLRGSIVPLIDLRVKFNTNKVKFTPMTAIVVTQVQNQHLNQIVGFIVDAVSEVYSVDKKLISPPPDTISTEEGKHIKGIATIDKKMITLLTLNDLYGVTQKSNKEPETQSEHSLITSQ